MLLLFKNRMSFHCRGFVERRHVLRVQQQQLISMSFRKHETWSEGEVMALPPGEHDYFERKAGALFDDDDNALLDAIAKAASAFANSGGGHLLLGVANDGSLDGVPARRARTSTREWLEQKIPDLLDYRLSDFRVHNVSRSDPSSILDGREIIVVDFGDSALAPHQSRRDKKYYYRSASHSAPAPHFYLELLRHRLLAPSLSFSLTALELRDAYLHEGRPFIELDAVFRIENTGRLAAYKWALVPRHWRNEKLSNSRREDIFFGTHSFPLKKPGGGGIPLDTTILPGLSYRETLPAGFWLNPDKPTTAALTAEIERVLGELTVGYQLASEMSPGEVVEVTFRSLLAPDRILERVAALFVDAAPGASS